MYDSLNMHSLESSLIDIMRAEQDPMKSKASFSVCFKKGVGGGDEGVGIMFAEEVQAVGGRGSRSRVVFPHTSLFSSPA